MCISPPSAWIASSLTGRRAASISSGKAAISTGVAFATRNDAATEAGSSNSTTSASSTRPASAARPDSPARSSVTERFDVLRNWKIALSPCGSNGNA